MKYKRILFLVAVSCMTSGAYAQIDPGWTSWAVTGSGWGNGGTVSATVYAEAFAANIVIEHWVVRDPDNWGFGVEGGRFAATGERYESAQDFLHHMWRQSIDVDEQWYYARQTVVYTPLAEAARMPWFGDDPPVGCLSLVDETGRIVGRQIRTRAWSLFTDHWVLYPSYRTPSKGGRVSFVDVTEDGCLMPSEFIASEFRDARDEADIGEYRHATATFSLVPLMPAGAASNDDEAVPRKAPKREEGVRSQSGRWSLVSRFARARKK